ncbi:multidrug resistance protein 2 [Scheffersomyces stipitis CBS 6054]|uniref:Multidrug resistance protein 2 n=1 Tax=Scheffersomyces stipitis (strain ATCC 58785 / CBS 6054 / NBRC 10063 / NRRL Y-11545) TaxID=322104 RepID=A3LTP7_PICST|nr:multidrug resistance protein 2 [Scheffersomyces stipitis CBS 6054]ABN66451.1 multidrug resistance protein 2 [Scheffersomyces stipitis CBS 6054]
MANFVKDSFWGTFVNRISGRRLFQHKEDRSDYVIPEKYLPGYKEEAKAEGEVDADDNASSSTVTKTGDDKVIVTWDSDDDPENPYNWPLYQKILLLAEVAFLTVSVYMGAAIYTPGVEDIMIKFNINRTLATLPLTMFVVGYGLGPMFLSPMTENAAIGRTPVYIVTLFIFFVLQIPTALSESIAGLAVLRLISGFFASPALATGGATIGDVISMPYMPVGIAAWAIGGVCGPSLGPLIGSVLVVKGSWRWPFWFMAIISGTCFLVLSWTLPETYGKALLYKKAKRLRRVTGNQNITSEGHIENSKLTAKELAVDLLWRPFEITIIEPVVLLINVYIALVYTVMYLWFEAFPIVFVETKHFTLIEMGVSYVSVMVGIFIGAAIYIPIIYRAFTKKVLAGEMVTPEVFLPSAIFGSIMMPIGIFVFGWSASPDLHWIGPIIGAALFATGAFIIFQTLFNYLGASFYRYLASVFASNALFRSVIAGCFPLFGDALFKNVGSEKYPVGWGSSILGFIALAMIAIPVFFALNGPKLRARSRYAN